MALETTYEEWAAAALAAVDAVFAEQDTLTADDLHGRVEEPDHPNWWGRSSKHQNSSEPPAGAANAKTRLEKDAPGQ